MKKKSLSELLRKLEDAQIGNSENISSLSEKLSRKMIRGGYDTHNGICSGSNTSCWNTSCHGTSNGICRNDGCLI